MMNHNHPFHMVSISPWPLIMSMNLLNFMVSFVNWLNNLELFWIIFFNLMILCLSLFQWWRDVIRESLYQGSHTIFIIKLIKLSMIMFIISELMFFISFFWTYIHAAISPNIEIGMMWPPLFIEPFNPYNIPLLNSIILITSGMTITWAHYSLINNNKKSTLKMLCMTLTLSIYFTYVQLMEYSTSPFSMNDSIYGSIFFISTGFHGLHVIMGTIFILTSTIRIFYNHMTQIHHMHFMMASWYWHFVDIIWLILYFMIYWWMF